MKKLNIILATLTVMGVMSACEDKLDLTNPNQQTTTDFGNTASDLNESVIACYNHIRMEGTYARVGYTLDVCRGDEVWNSSQIWYLPFDNLNVGSDIDIGQWPYRDWYYTINVCNYVLSKVDKANLSETEYNQIKGQALFIRGLGYYNLVNYFQAVPLMNDYKQYSDLNSLYEKNTTTGVADAEGIYGQYNLVCDQIESDFSAAMGMLPSRDAGGEWAGGRATCGAAAGFYARTLMLRHKFNEALTVLKDIINGNYGHYALVADYGDNCREGAAYENNDESLFEIQYLDFANQGTDDEWTPVNTSPNATQGHAVESNYAPGAFGGWADLSASPWLYNLFKAEKCEDGTLDPRLYWTIASYEKEYEQYNGSTSTSYAKKIGGSDPRCNIAWTNQIPAEGIVTNNNNGGIVLSKNTSARQGLYSSVVTGLHCGVNLRIMRYSDVLLRAAECENELNGPTANAFDWINQVRNRAGLKNLDQSKFTTKEALFEQIANVERPKEFGGEFGRGIDLLRWGFFYSDERLEQMREHGAFKMQKSFTSDLVSVDSLSADGYDSPINYYVSGHEYFPLYIGTLTANPKLVGNSANDVGIDNKEYFISQYGQPHAIPAE